MARAKAAEVTHGAPDAGQTEDALEVGADAFDAEDGDDPRHDHYARETRQKQEEKVLYDHVKVDFIEFVVQTEQGQSDYQEGDLLKQLRYGRGELHDQFVDGFGEVGEAVTRQNHPAENDGDDAGKFQALVRAPRRPGRPRKGKRSSG